MLGLHCRQRWSSCRICSLLGRLRLPVSPLLLLSSFRLSSRCGRCRLSWLRRLLCMVQRCRVFGRPKKLSWRRLLRLL